VAIEPVVFWCTVINAVCAVVSISCMIATRHFATETSDSVELLLEYRERK
jgi:hypothetical protein